MRSTADGFEPEFKDACDGYSETVAQRSFMQIDRLARWLHAVVDGVSKLPPGRALLIASHAFGLDVAFAVAAIRRETGRRVWIMGEHVWCELSVVRRLGAAVGTVDGTAANADRLLSTDHLVLVLPGGFREVARSRELSDRVLSGHRYDFARAAVRNQAPIVPLVSRGFDDLCGPRDGYERAESSPRRAGVTAPVLSCLLPNHSARLRCMIGDPISPQFAPQRATDLATVRLVRRQVEDAVYEMLDADSLVGSASH